VRKQLVVLLLALAIAVGFSGTVFAQPVHAKHVNYLQKTVPIYSGAYHPKFFTVKTGTTVIWINRDHKSHTVTSVNGLFNSGIIKPGGHYKLTFTKTGIYRYYCTLHPKTMRGTMVVVR
jgi:plastocyanin